jgi:hypothetical protein
MAQPTYGTHRVKNPGLTDGKNGFEIPESRYRENGYKPRVEELPWRSSERANYRFFFFAKITFRSPYKL